MVVKCMGFQSDESRAHGVVSFLESVNHPYSSLVYTDYLDYNNDQRTPSLDYYVENSTFVRVLLELRVLYS